MSSSTKLTLNCVARIACRFAGSDVCTETEPSSWTAVLVPSPPPGRLGNRMSSRISSPVCFDRIMRATSCHERKMASGKKDGELLGAGLQPWARARARTRRAVRMAVMRLYISHEAKNQRMMVEVEVGRARERRVIMANGVGDDASGVVALEMISELVYLALLIRSSMNMASDHGHSR